MFKKKDAWLRAIYVSGMILTLLIVLTPYPKQFAKHLGQIFLRGTEKLSQINWMKMPTRSYGAKDLAFNDVVMTPPPPSASPSPPPPSSASALLAYGNAQPTQSKWSWPSFSKSETSRAKPKHPSPPPPDPPRNPWPIPKRLTLSHIEGNNFTNCFATNYTKAQLLFAGEYLPGRFLPQIDFRGDRFDDTTYAASGGVVLRYIPKKDGPINRILGANLYYDYRQGNVGFFNQIGGGIEILSKRWDFRANVYVPVGGKRKLRHCVFDEFEGDFLAIKDTFESVSFAYNLEVGWLAVNSQYLLVYLAGGPYYIAGRKCFDKTRGGEIRIQPQYKDFIALNAIYSYDPLFNSVYQFEVILHLPLYLLSKKIDKKETCGLTPRQIYQPVVRYDVMPIGRCTCWMFNWDDLIPNHSSTCH